MASVDKKLSYVTKFRRNSMYQDEKLICEDCGKEFDFTAGEQEFYASKGLTNKPKRCPECRKARRQKNRRKMCSYGAGNKREMRGHESGSSKRCGRAMGRIIQKTAAFL